MKEKNTDERDFKPKMNILEAMKKSRLYFDGGTGTELIVRGLEVGKTSESANLEHPEWVVDIHKAYIAAGANIIKTNTFGVNKDKFDNYEEIIKKLNLKKGKAKSFSL